ncbi:MAG: hypothetical protein M4579_000438 [Chaenotheca gracillima]|nr:MAG: hypothetical protein M4579_000438 [Chaenotheca gracillima]
MWLIKRLAAFLGYSPRSPSAHSPDVNSPLYPDRPIRPLPKRRIRSRLSSEAADSILAPIAPSTSQPLFHYPYSYSDNTQGSPATPTPATVEKDLVCGHGQQSRPHVRADEIDSEDDDDRTRAARIHRAQQGYVTADDTQANMSLYRSRLDQSALPQKPPPAPMSTSSSVDGYDSFENTNNKKKRKIPTSGNANGHHSHLSLEMANMDLSNSHSIGTGSMEDAGGVAGPYSSPSTGSPALANGAATARGRLSRSYGRNGVVRSPLAVTTDGSNARMGGRGHRAGTKDRAASVGLKNNQRVSSQPTQMYYDGATPAGEQGIISSAMANAPEQGKGPVLSSREPGTQQPSAKKSTPTKTQFTFTPSADVTWPGGNSMGSGVRGAANGTQPPGTRMPRGMANQGTQTSPTAAGGRVAQSTALNASGGVPQQPPAQGKKQRARRPGKQYTLAARQRRLQQEYSNYHNPPANEDIWICEFCEYESIFGSPPEALVRQYEIKDRRERRRLAEKRRLLEKAKMKGRKGKKGSKAAAAAKNNAATAAAQPHQQQQQQSGHAQHQYAADGTPHPDDGLLDGEDEDDYPEDDERLDDNYLRGEPIPRVLPPSSSQNFQGHGRGGGQGRSGTASMQAGGAGSMRGGAYGGASIPA